MKINNINLNFTKKLCAACIIKDKQRTKHPAFIYEYNPRDIEDMKEIQTSDNTNSIKWDFFKEGYLRRYMPESKYYAMKDDNNDITACAKITEHFARRGKFEGFYTSIDEFEASDKYINSTTPMIGFIANISQKHLCQNILTAKRDDEIQDLGECKFKKQKQGFWSLRSRAFDECISRAEKRNNLEIFV